MKPNTPTDRELAILDVLWTRGEATVRTVYEELRQELPIVQNTVQAFLRTMTEKGLVTYRVEGRSFVYRAAVTPEEGRGSVLNRVWQRAYDGALDRLVAGAIHIKPPSTEELARLRELLDQVERDQGDQPAQPSQPAQARQPGSKSRGETQGNTKRQAKRKRPGGSS